MSRSRKREQPMYLEIRGPEVLHTDYSVGDSMIPRLCNCKRHEKLAVSSSCPTPRLQSDHGWRQWALLLHSSAPNTTESGFVMPSLSTSSFILLGWWSPIQRFATLLQFAATFQKKPWVWSWTNAVKACVYLSSILSSALQWESPTHPWNFLPTTRTPLSCCRV